MQSKPILLYISRHGYFGVDNSDGNNRQTQTDHFTGPVHDMFLTACDLSPHLQQYHGRAPQLGLQSIQPFHKQLYFHSLKEKNKEKGMQVTTMTPITVKRSDPVS